MDNTKKIFIGADHAGFEAKAQLITYLKGLEFTVEDLGNTKNDLNDDYPDFIIPVAKAVIENPGSRGIVIGGSGQGEAMAANKIKGIRAALVYDEYSASMSRAHNDANVAAFGARVTEIPKMKELVERWLSAPFTKEDRHQRRIEKLNNI